MKLKNIITLAILALVSFMSGIQTKDGISFVVIGDFGYMKNFTAANEVFD